MKPEILIGCWRAMPVESYAMGNFFLPISGETTPKSVDKVT